MKLSEIILAVVVLGIPGLIALSGLLWLLGKAFKWLFNPPPRP